MDRIEVLLTAALPAAAPDRPVPPASLMLDPGTSLHGVEWQSESYEGVRVTQVALQHPPIEGEEQEVAMAPELGGRLALMANQPCWLRLGLRRVRAVYRPDPALPPEQVQAPPGLAGALALSGPLRLSAWRARPGEIALGPLVGLLVSRAKLEAVLSGHLDTVYCRYSTYAREVGAALFFFAPDGLDPDAGAVQGYQLERSAGGDWAWHPRRFPLPRVVYDRCFGQQSRMEAAAVRSLARRLGMTVVNHPVKIAKLQALEVLREYPELGPYLPFTAPLTPASLFASLRAYDDLYLKPNALYKGQGVYRLVRCDDGWLLQSREEWGNAVRPLAGPAAVAEALEPFLDPEAHYLVQEGLSLATYLGNRFDFRALVQKDGRGEWAVTGVVARLAPLGSVITSPRSGGHIAAADRVLRHAFPDRWQAVYSELERVSVAVAERMESQLGPCAELGLDAGVLADGAVRLIEVNGKPLKVSLQRLHDPLVAEQMNRCPIHYAASLDLAEVGA